MRTYANLLLILFAVLGIAALTLISGFQSNGQSNPIQNKRAIDERHFPTVEFTAPEPADPVQRSKRRARGRKYDKSDWGVNAEALSDSTVRVDFVDRSLPAFPLAQSTVIVIGEISDATAYLSNDKTGVYSVFAVRISEVLKNGSRVSLSLGDSIEIEREGGRVRFPSGRTHLYMGAEQEMPHIGSRYLVFLADGDNGPTFQLITGYELHAGKVRPLDDLPKLRAYDNANEVNFLSELRAKISNP